MVFTSHQALSAPVPLIWTWAPGIAARGRGEEIVASLPKHFELASSCSERASAATHRCYSTDSTCGWAMTCWPSFKMFSKSSYLSGHHKLAQDR